MSPNYSHITDFFEKNVCYRKKTGWNNEKWFNEYKSELLADPVFTQIYEAVNHNLEKIFPVNFQSFSNPGTPTKIRLRSDGFLKCSKQWKLYDTFILFSCVKVNNVKTYVVLTSNYFANYSFSIRSSNSFFTKEFSDLQEWSSSPDGITVHQRRASRTSVTTFIYWHGTFDEHSSLSGYMNLLSSIPQNGYSFVARSLNRGPSIPRRNREMIREIYDNSCAFKIVNSCSTYRSRNEDILKHIHHIIPREFFNDHEIYDGEIINNLNNLILLCYRCHEDVHSRNVTTRSEAFENIISVLKEENKFNDFLQYLTQTVHITLPLLYNVYGLDFDGANNE